MKVVYYLMDGFICKEYPMDDDNEKIMLERIIRGGFSYTIETIDNVL